MTIQINIGDHISSELNFIPIPNQSLPDMRWARIKALWIVKNISAADGYFRTLPGGRSLTALLADRTIWINYHATTNAFGLTNAVSGKEIAIGRPAFRIGRWTILATLIHELAHSNGAPGGTDTRAERAVLACGMGKISESTSGIDDPWTPYNPTIGG